jgi:hypothetical protein
MTSDAPLARSAALSDSVTTTRGLTVESGDQNASAMASASSLSIDAGMGLNVGGRRLARRQRSSNVERA